MKKNNTDLEFYSNGFAFFETKASQLTENDFVFQVKAEGLSGYLFKTEDEGLTILWPNKELEKKIASLRKNAETIKKAQKIMKSLFIPKLITNAKEFNNAVSKSGERLAVEKEKDGKVFLSNGIEATYDPKVRSIPFFGNEGKENVKKFAVWNINKISTKFGGNENLESNLLFFKDLLNKSKAERTQICKKYVAAFTNSEDSKCLVQGFPFAELMVLTCTNLIGNCNIGDIRLDEVQEQYKICNKSDYVTGSLKCPEISSVYNFYREIHENNSYNGTLIGPSFICKNLYALQEFFYKLDLIMKKDKKDLFDIVAAICLLNCRINSGKYLPFGFMKTGEESEGVLRGFFQKLKPYFLETQTEEFFGGNETMKNHILNLIKNLNEKEIKELKNSL